MLVQVRQENKKSNKKPLFSRGLSGRNEWTRTTNLPLKNIYFIGNYNFIAHKLYTHFL